jgi:hypothetical protein
LTPGAAGLVSVSESKKVLYVLYVIFIPIEFRAIEISDLFEGIATIACCGSIKEALAGLKFLTCM